MWWWCLCTFVILCYSNCFCLSLYLPLPLCFSLSLCLLLPLPIPSVCVFISFSLFLTLPIVIIICNARTIIIALLINLFLTPSEFVCGYIYLGLMYCNIRRQCYSAILGCNRRHSAWVRTMLEEFNSAHMWYICSQHIATRRRISSAAFARSTMKPAFSCWKSPVRS